MPKLTPDRGGGYRLTPDGKGDYTSERITFPDPLEGADDEERRFFIDRYGPLSMLEMCQRLRVAEWNAEERRQALKGAEAEIRKLRRDAAPPDRSTPPAGWELPKAAADLLACAERNGWMSITAWGERPGGDVMVTIQLAHGRRIGEAWRFEHLTWYASGVGTSMHRGGRGLQSTPDAPAWHDAPSISRICAVIDAHPAWKAAA